MTHVAKIRVSWQIKDGTVCRQAAINEARKTIRGIKGLEVADMTVKVDRNTGNITQYRAACESCVCSGALVIIS